MLRRCYLLTAITLTWVLFRIGSLRDVMNYGKVMVIPALSPTVRSVWTGELTLVVLAALLFSFPFAGKAVSCFPAKVREFLLPPCYLLLFVITLAAVASGAFNPFIYARF